MGKDISCNIEMYFALPVFETLLFLISLGMVIRLLNPNSFWSFCPGIFNDKNIYRTISLSLPVMSYMTYRDEQYNSNSGRSLIALVWTILLEIIRTTLVPPWELWESIEQLIRIFWVMYLVAIKSSLEKGLRVDLVILCVCGLIFEIFKAVILKKAEKSPQLGKNPELVAIYMEQIMKNDDNQDLPMTTSLSSCKYIVFEEANGYSTFGPNYDLTGQTQSSPDNLITVGKLFQLNSEIDRELNTSYPCWREIGISFALAKMLRRRFSRLPLVEAGTREALEFVLNGLMGSCNNSEEDLISEEVDEDIAKRVFRIIRTELSFLTDILHIEVSAFYNSLGIVFHWSFFIAFICTCPYIIWAVITRRKIWLSPATVDMYKKCANMFLNLTFRDRNVAKWILNVSDILITVTLIFSCVFNLIMWLWRYYNSNWRTLHIIRDILKDPTEHIKVHKRSFNFQKRDEIPSNWPETIEHTHLGFDFGFLGPLSWVHADVQKALLTSLKNNKGKITSGQSSLERQNVFQDLKWACQPNQSNTEAILVWHIATVLFNCHNHPSQQYSDRKTALTLSNYCEYLINSFPELLPDAVYWIESVYKKLKEDITRAPKHTDEISQSKEVNEEISRAKPSNKISESEISLCRKILHGKWNEGSVVEKGVRLFNDLKVRGGTNEAVWKLLADFWAEMMLYIAPSDNVKGHENIMDKKELITQVWALLTHAGITTRPQIPEHHYQGNNAV